MTSTRIAQRLVPTGICWCGCGVQVDLGSFFAPGHDKKAEARLIMEVFGGVPQFLVAFGRGPDGLGAGMDSASISQAMKLSSLTQGSRAYMSLEYPALEDRTGPLQRLDRGYVQLITADVSDAQAVFRVSPPNQQPNMLFIPFLDIASVYGGQNAVTVRIRGSLDLNSPQVRYVSFVNATDGMSYADFAAQRLEFLAFQTLQEMGGRSGIAQAVVFTAPGRVPLIPTATPAQPIPIAESRLSLPVGGGTILAWGFDRVLSGEEQALVRLRVGGQDGTWTTHS